MTLLFATFHIFKTKASSKILDFHWGDYNSSNPIGMTINRHLGHIDFVTKQPPEFKSRDICARGDMGGGGVLLNAGGVNYLVLE